MLKLISALVALVVSALAFADETGTMATTTTNVAAAIPAVTEKAWFALAAAGAITFAAIGGAYAQGKAASVALEGIARNPAASDKLFTPMIIALALIESLVIYAFVIAFLVKP